MKIVYTPRFKRSFRDFPREIRKKFAKQVDYLLIDVRYPSLHAKKYDEQRNIWQARVDRNIRFYFTIHSDTYILLEIRVHPK